MFSSSLKIFENQKLGCRHNSLPFHILVNCMIFCECLFHTVENRRIPSNRKKNKNLSLGPIKILPLCCGGGGKLCSNQISEDNEMCPHLKVHFQYQFITYYLFSFTFLLNIGSFVALKITVQESDLFIHSFIYLTRCL